MTKSKVVILEDEGLIEADLKRRLEGARYAAPSMEDTGPLALQAVAEMSPDVVMMDIRLRGDMGGIEVAGRVRGEFDLPVRSRSQTFGYIEKPVSAGSLRGPLELALPSLPRNPAALLLTKRNLLGCARHAVATEAARNGLAAGGARVVPFPTREVGPEWFCGFEEKKQTEEI